MSLIPTQSYPEALPRQAAPAVPALLAWLILILIVPAALVGGFFSAETWVLGVAAAAGFAALLAFFLAPLSVPVKLVFFLITVAFLQRSLGYFKVGGVRGLNVGNLLIAAAVGYWILNGLRTGRWYRRTPVDFWLFLAVFVIPSLSILYTLAFRKVPGYTLGSQLSWYKQWITPFLYFFLLIQCFDRRRDIHYLIVLVVFLVGVAVLDALPETLRFSSWHDSRAEGFIQEANAFAALLATTSPFLFLLLFLLRGRPVVRLLILGLLAGVAVSLLTTYSRSGYIGFALALFGAFFVAYRATGRMPVGLPVLILAGSVLIPVVAAPQVVDYVTERFQVKSYKRAKRKSYGTYRVLNQFAGDRLEIWQGAIGMAQDYPFFGVGFHAFETELPNYHSLGTSNYPHNVFLGSLAEGGIVWLTAMLVLYWKLLRYLYQSWKIALAEKSAWGSIVSGGALVCFVVMVWISLTLDFNHPSPKTTLFWVIIAGAVKYGLLPREPGDRSTAPAR